MIYLLDSWKFYSFNKYLSSPRNIFFFLTFDEIESNTGFFPTPIIPIMWSLGRLS